jgi:DNA-binding LacI/PurR family transcriptional regulator
MGRFLAALGHRNVAFLAPHDSPQWCMNRLAGLRQALGVQISSAEVRTFASPGHALRDAALRVRGDAAQVSSFAASESGTVHAAKARGIARALLTAADDLSRVAQIARQAGSPGVVSYDQVLRDRSMTAWVGANDSIALGALRFLAGRGVRVPGDLTVVGFDDTEEAFLQQLTSYNFNAPAVMQSMLDHVLGYGRQRRSRTMPESVEIEGYIAQRGTSGRVG